MFSLRIWRDLTALLHGIEMKLAVVAVVGWLGQRWIWVDEPLTRWFPARVRERMSEELGLYVVMQWWWRVVDVGITAEIDGGRLDLEEKDELKESCEND